MIFMAIMALLIVKLWPVRPLIDEGHPLIVVAVISIMILETAGPLVSKLEKLMQGKLPRFDGNPKDFVDMIGWWNQ